MFSRPFLLTSLLVLLIIVVAVQPTFTMATSTSVTLISRTPNGERGNGTSHSPVLSDDGQLVVFLSEATNLGPDPAGGRTNVFLYDRQANQMTRISQPISGMIGGENALAPTISGNGQTIAFDSKARNLVPGDTDTLANIFFYERAQASLSRLLAPDGSAPNGDATTPTLSRDGRLVAFTSNATNLVPGDNEIFADIFVYDRQTNTFTVVSRGMGGAVANNGSLNPALSANGRLVAFSSNASNLVANDTNAVRDVFVYDRQTETTSRVSVASDGTEANGLSDEPKLSADGRFVVFRSNASNLVANDRNGKTDIFVHDRQTAQTIRVSVVSGGGEVDEGSYGASISADGQLVAFRSDGSNLIDQRSASEIFVHNRQTGQTQRVSPTVSSGLTLFAEHAALSSDGTTVAFASNLLARANETTVWDTDVFVSSLTNPPASPSNQVFLPLIRR